MPQIIIYITTENIKQYINIVQKLDYDIDISPKNNKRIMIDGKSVMGILSLDLSKPLVLTAHTSEDNISDLKIRLKDYLV